MWKVPVTAPEALPYIVEAAQRDGYLGLMVILARTAEARTLHKELSRDWTSIHDVTGHRIAVLCPDPHFVDPEDTDRDLPFVTENSYSRFWLQLTLADSLDFKHTKVLIPGRHSMEDAESFRGVPVSRPPYPEDVQQAAWTEAVTRCAAVFGVGESRLPALLVLCLREQQDVLIQLRPETSLFRLCKKIASHPGYSPEDDLRLRERARLKGRVADLERRRRFREDHGRHEWRKVDDAPKSMRRLLAVDSVRKQIDGLQQHLTRVAHVDPDAHHEWVEILKELVRSDAAEEAVQTRLSEMVDSVRAHPRKVEWRSLDKKIKKVQHAVRAAAEPPSVLQYIPEGREERIKREKQDEERFTRAQAELEELEIWLDGKPGLAEACRTAAQAEMGSCAVEQLKLSECISIGRNYETERIQAVRPVGPSPEPGGSNIAVSNNLSGTIHGPAVQAGRTGDIHLHVHGTRRSGVAWLAHLQRAWKKRRDGLAGQDDFSA